MDKARTATDATIKVDTFRHCSGGPGLSGSYRGLRIHALGGLHEFMAERALAHLPAGVDLLELGAGSGALSLRLADLGYRVSATDYVVENFRLHGDLPFLQLDLNGDFATRCGGRFGALMACEIIEHLENPRHFARQCFKLLRSGGKLLLSTPNIDNIGAITQFLRRGTFTWFSDYEYEHDGHITPLTQWQIEKCFLEAGFRFLWRGSCGNRDHVFKPSRRARLARHILRWLARDRSALREAIFVAVLEKPGAPP
ncbi:MAG: methyltransferase domain-containing protein [Pseudomonadota bacterium]